MLSAIGLVKVLTGLHDLVMGVTILSVGNCFPGRLVSSDLFICAALASKGYTIMAVTGITAGIMFNFLFGFALSYILSTIRTGNSELSLFGMSRETLKHDLMMLILLCSSILIFAFLLVRVVYRK